MTGSPPRDLTLVVCAAPLSERAADIARAFVADAWTVRVVVTPTAADWLDGAEIETVTGERPICMQRARDQPSNSGGSDSVVLAAPLTFNTLNKWAAGIADNYALGVLCEALSVGRRTVAVPVIGDRLWHHPVLDQHVQLLAAAKVEFVNLASGGQEVAPVESGTAVALAAEFDVQALVAKFV